MAAYQNTGEIGGTFVVQATAKPGVDLAKVERAMDEELARFLAEGPRPEELQRVRTEDIAGFVRGVERIGGFGGKSDVLARNQVYFGEPDAWKKRYARVKVIDRGAARDARDSPTRLCPRSGIRSRSRLAGEAGSSAGAARARNDGERRFSTARGLKNGLKLAVVARHAVPVGVRGDSDAGSRPTPSLCRTTKLAGERSTRARD